MKEAMIAKAYATSIFDLGVESKIDVTSEFTQLTEVINSNNDLETVLFLDVFTIEEKQAVITDILAKMNLSSLVKNTVLFLMQEQRIGLLPMIYKNLVVKDDHQKGFLRGVIEGSDESIDVEVESHLKAYLKNKLGAEAKLTYKKNENLTAGYRVTVDDLQLDATLDNQFDKLKSEILNS
jgi:F-type H+-transporting ATPase subunit delta